MSKKQVMAAALRTERNERMRRARNAMFYASASNISDSARKSFRDTATEYVREARELGHRALLA